MAAPRRPGSMRCWRSTSGSSRNTPKRRRSRCGATTRCGCLVVAGAARRREEGRRRLAGQRQFPVLSGCDYAQWAILGVFLGDRATRTASPICWCRSPRSRSSTTGRCWASPAPAANRWCCTMSSSPSTAASWSPICSPGRRRARGASGLPGGARAARLSGVLFAAAGSDRARPQRARTRVPRPVEPHLARRDQDGRFRSRADDDRRGRRGDRQRHAALHHGRDSVPTRSAPAADHRRRGDEGAARHGLRAAPGRLGDGAPVRDCPARAGSTTPTRCRKCAAT